MKKALIFFILLIIFAAVGGYFGWVSIQPGYYGVAFSSITGIKNYPLEAGKFYWLWEKLIPKHFKLYLIKETPTIIEFSFSTTLPGSNDLKEYGNFELGIKGKIQYSIDFNTAKNLISKGIINNQKDYFKKLIESSIQQNVSNFTLQIFNNINNGNYQIDYSVLDILRKDIAKVISNELSSYGIKKINLNISYSSIPQIDIYSKALQLYMEYINSVYQAQKEELKRKAERTAQYEKNKAELKHLEDIGMLVEKYPGLLKYMYLEKLGDKIKVVVIPEGKSGFPSFLESERLTEKRNFIPIPNFPEEKNTPVTPESNLRLREKEKPQNTTTESEKVTSKTSIEKQSKTGESSISKSNPEKKWYEYLKFWDFFKKNK